MRQTLSFYNPTITNTFISIHYPKAVCTLVWFFATGRLQYNIRFPTLHKTPNSLRLRFHILSLSKKKGLIWFGPHLILIIIESSFSHDSICSLSLSLRTHTHTHTDIYIYIYSHLTCMIRIVIFNYDRDMYSLQDILLVCVCSWLCWLWLKFMTLKSCLIPENGRKWIV